jgi:hypothetical protein
MFPTMSVCLSRLFADSELPSIHEYIIARDDVKVLNDVFGWKVYSKEYTLPSYVHTTSPSQGWHAF